MNWPEKVASRYRLVGQVGAGGMGLVYKAIDVRLDRAVAIKAINRARLEKAGASEKLRLEAMAAASLDHPYICRIYELIDEDADTFIVMEFVEGETLAAMMQRGPLPLAEALRLASEIAEGLANAHARGLVHRDIKPANVMVTPHGHVKLLDFGIAQADVAATPDAHTKTSPDAPMGHGGTPHYMSPEQATGGPVTARADLFALGVVIYECVTGRLPFEGTTDYDYVHHLIATAPKPMHKLAPDAPEELVSLVEQCLERTPAHRPDSAVSVAKQLRRIAGLLTAPSGSLESVTTVRRRRRRMFGIAAALGALAVAGILAWQWMQPKWLPVGRDRPVTTSPGREFGSRISPDGKWVLFIGTRGDARQVFVQQIDALQPQAVSLPPGLYDGCLWSPDQARLACLGWQGDQLTLQVVPAFGGAVLQSIAMPDVAGSVQLVRWIDASIYLVTRGQARGALKLERLNLANNQRTDVPGPWTTMQGVEELDLRPDAREVILVVTIQGEGRELWVADVGGAKSERLTPEDDRSMKAMPVWSTDGRSIVYQSNLGGQADLWEIDRRTGQQRRLTTSQAIERPESVSVDGSVSFQLIDETAALWSWPIGAPGAGRPINEEALSAFAPTLSRDGRVLAFQRSLPSPREGFVVMDSMLVAAEIDRQALRNMRDVREGFLPRLSPDGSRLAYFQRAPSGGARVLMMTLGTGETLSLSESGTLAANLPSFPVVWWDQPLVWSPSGDALYFVERDGGNAAPTRIRRLRVAEGKNGLATLVETPSRISDLQVSPNGRLIAYLASRSTAAEQTGSGARVWELHVLDVESKNDEVWATLQAESRISCRGWAPGGKSAVLARTVKVHDDTTHSIEVLSVSGPNQVRSLRTIDHVVRQTLRMPESKSSLYMTRSEAGVANVYAFSLESGALTAITDNALVDVTFGSVELLGPDRLAGVRDVRKHDIWLLDARSRTLGNPASASR